MTFYEVFISYRRNGGEALAKRLKERLEDNAVLTFYDNNELSFGDYRRQLVLNNFTSKCLVLLLTNNDCFERKAKVQNSLGRCENEGDWVKREIKLAMLMHKRIIPIIEDGFSFEGLPQTHFYKKLQRCVKKDGIHYNGYNVYEVVDALMAKLRKGWSDEEIRASVNKIAEYKRVLEQENEVDIEISGYDEAYEQYVDDNRDYVRIGSRVKVVFLVLSLIAILSSFMVFYIDGAFSLNDESVLLLLLAGMPFGLFYRKNERLILDKETSSPIGQLSFIGIFVLLKELLLGVLKAIACIIPIGIAANVITNQAWLLFVGVTYMLVLLTLFIFIPYLRVFCHTLLTVYDFIIAYSSAYFCVIFRRRGMKERIEKRVNNVTAVLGIAFFVLAFAGLAYLSYLQGGDKIA